MQLKTIKQSVNPYQNERHIQNSDPTLYLNLNSAPETIQGGLIADKAEPVTETMTIAADMSVASVDLRQAEPLATGGSNSRRTR